jgi:hypothetical protein
LHPVPASSDMTTIILFTERGLQPGVEPQTWRTRSLYLCLPVTGWPGHRGLRTCKSFKVSRHSSSPSQYFLTCRCNTQLRESKRIVKKWPYSRMVSTGSRRVYGWIIFEHMMNLKVLY